MHMSGDVARDAAGPDADVGGGTADGRRSDAHASDAIISLGARSAVDGRSCTVVQLYRFLDAGDTESFRMRSRPASKKRRGTKSREGGRRRSSECYPLLPFKNWATNERKARESGLRLSALAGNKIRADFRIPGDRPAEGHLSLLGSL